MIKLDVFLLICWSVTAAGLPSRHVQSEKAPCLLQVPCTQGDRETVAEDCNRYRQCVGPSEWTSVVCDPGTDIFRNTTGECDGFQCSQWSCELRYTSPLQDPAPCLSSGIQCEEGKTIADRYYCTWYYKCVSQVWGRIQCPLGEYFSPALSELGVDAPCSPNIGVCDTIEYANCLGEENPDPADDACNPAVPCTPGDTVSDPTSCWRYQICVAPYEWVVSSHDCGGLDGPYNNQTGTCHPDNNCLPTWQCPITPTPTPMNPRPCVEDETAPCAGGPEFVPDSYYCSSYHQCVLNQWVARECPAGQYFSLTLASIGVDPPCIDDETYCLEIPFDQCTDTSYPGDQNPCDPTLPCTQGDKINYPWQCEQYQQCTGPYEWSLIGCPVGEEFSNVTQECHPLNVCDPWVCGPGSTQPSKEPMPCLVTNSTTCTDGTTVPDSYHCTSYFKCVDGAWVLLICPQETPFYSTERAEGNAIIPCSPFPSICDRIPYESCRNTTTVPSNGCTPPVPCVPGNEASYPPLCSQYQVCAAPYQWDVITCEGGGNYNNVTDECSPAYPCHEWPCDASQPTVPEPVPCTVNPQCTDGDTAPDKHTCTSYFKCVNGVWVELSCPVDTPYFSMTLSQAGAIVPCVSEISNCYEIPFEFCNSTIPEGPDACAPPVPCQPGDRVSYPTDPERYQECVAPYQWEESDFECGGIYGCFSNITDDCRPGNPCDPWSCGGGGPDPPTTSPEPCFTELPVLCTAAEVGDTLPSRYHCSLYFKCDGTEWVSLVCPVDDPYYSMTLAALDVAIPCTDEITICYEIPYDECLDPAIGLHLEAGPLLDADVDTEIDLTDFSVVRAAGPCLPVPDYECKDGRVVPDRLGCMTYYTCSAGVWVQRECPPYTPYYDVELADRATGAPCTNDLAKCDVIPFDTCQVPATKS